MTTKQNDGRGAGDDDATRDRDGDQDPGAYIGRLPERATETIPGGVSDRDERVAAHSTRSGPTAGDPIPDGHREGAAVTDDTIREAGQDR
jgi:hypothetical protein